MLKLATFLAIGLLPFAALAQTGPYSPRMTCATAAGLVARQGAVVIATGPSTYDRYVDHQRQCLPPETTRPAWVATRDNPQCFIGYTCEIREPGGFRF